MFEHWGLFGRAAAPGDKDDDAEDLNKGCSGGNIFLDPEESTAARSRDVRRLTLPEAVVLARRRCTMSHLVGAAPVVYGIPTVLE